ncbi:MAG: phage tail protein, partial [Mesorhizobium sp.]|nr:phage tail protein [Mesorhizobium sp.]
MEADPSARPVTEGAGDEVTRPEEDRPAAEEAFSSQDNRTARTDGDSGVEQGGPARPYAAQPSPAAPARSGGAGRFAAGLAGGVVALLLAGLLQFAGLLGGTGTDGSGLQGQIDGLKAEIEAVKSGAGAAGSAELAAGLDAVRKDVAALQEALSAGAAGDGPALQALDQRLKELEATVSSLGSGSGAGEDVAALGDRIAAVEGAAKAAQQAADGVASQVAALEQSVSALSARVEAQANQPKIALAIATAALKSAVDRGAPFTAELETLAALAPQSPEIAELRSHAETGIATREALRAEFDAAAAAMIAAASPTDPNAGFFDRL